VLVEFLRILNEKHPDHLYVVTATSDSGVDLLERYRHDSICAAGFLPLDTVPAMKAMIARFGIRQVWLIETELWPAMLWVCMSRGIPVGIANARMEDKSYRLYSRFGFVFRPLLRHFTAALVQDEAYARRFEAIGVPAACIRVAGNIKSRVVIRRPSYDEWKKLRRQMNASEECTVVTAGCIHGAEGRVIRDAIERVRSDYRAWRWIIVPRHLSDIPELVDSLGPEAIHVKEPSMARDWRVCVVGKYGVMEDMYRMADVAVVGGTFVDVGGHNVWEAAQFGIPVLWGPSYHTQRASCERLLSAGVGFSVANGEELAESLVRILKKEPKSFIEAQTAFIAEIDKSEDSLEHVIP
jgi:3-deoxy-D-manno-octulosonic-acid transferase